MCDILVTKKIIWDIQSHVAPNNNLSQLYSIYILFFVSSQPIFFSTYPTRSLHFTITLNESCLTRYHGIIFEKHEPTDLIRYTKKRN